MSVSLHVDGGKRLRGELAANGSQKAGVALLAAAAAGTEQVTLVDLPDTRGIARQAEVLTRFGRTVEREAGHWCVLPGNSEAGPSGSAHLPWSALLFLGPILAYRGECVLPIPRTPTGPRPIDLHVKVLRALGAKAEIESGYLRVDGTSLRGCDVCLDAPTFGATWTAITLATRAHGRTRVIGASREPELVDAVNLLNRMGARIVGAGTEVVTVTGNTRLGGGIHEVIPDRIAAGFYLLAGAAAGGDISVTGIITDHLRAVTAKLEEVGVEVHVQADRVAISARENLKPISLRTGFYPAFPSELHPAVCSLLLKAQGTSIVVETSYEGVTSPLDELERMGGVISRDGQIAIIRGRQKLGSARVRAVDPESASALLIASLAAQGETIIEGAEELLEWFPATYAALSQLGAHVGWMGQAQVAG